MVRLTVTLLLGLMGIGALQQCDAKEDVYIITSKMNGRIPKIGPVKHVSIAFCPEGVSPIVYENGVPVSNCAQCRLYGTQFLERGFKPEHKRIGVSARKVTGVSAATVEARIRRHQILNIPLLNDCRHHAMQVVGRNKLKRPLGRLLAPLL
jgi:hypothetical protein